MPAVEVPDFLPLEQRALITTAGLAIQPFVWANPTNQPPMPLLDVVNHVRVSSGVVEWVETGADPVAAVVAEGTAKPEATLTFTPKTSTLDTIAHWVQITRQALADAPYMRSLIEGKLRNGLARKVQADLVTLLNAAVLTPAVNANLTTAIRIAVGNVEANGYTPNAVLLNPADFAAIDVANATAAQKGATRTDAFWGLKPVAVPGLTAGSAIVGDFKEGVTLFDRGVADVFVTDSPRLVLREQHPRNPRRGPLQERDHRSARPLRDGGGLTWQVTPARSPFASTGVIPTRGRCGSGPTRPTPSRATSPA